MQVENSREIEMLLFHCSSFSIENTVVMWQYNTLALQGWGVQSSLKLQCLHYNLCDEEHSNLWHTGLQFKNAVFEPMFRLCVVFLGC